MKYTFIVINKNGKQTLERCLSSIKNRVQTDFEIIVVDDCSSDNSVEIASKYANKVVKNEKCLGVGLSRNEGLRISNGKYVFIIDSDIEIKKLELQIIENSFVQKNVCAVFGFYKSSDSSDDWNTALDVRRKYIFGKQEKPIFIDKKNYTTFSGGFCVLNKAKIGDLKFEKENGYTGEDLIFQLELLNKGMTFLYLPDFIGLHLHTRATRNILKKLIREANGAFWVISKCSQLRLKAPNLEFAINFPLFLFLSLLTGRFLFISLLLLFIEFYPYIATLYKDRFSSSSFKLLSLAVIVFFVRIPLLLYWLFKTSTREGRIALIRFVLFSDIHAKYNFLKI